MTQITFDRSKFRSLQAEALKAAAMCFQAECDRVITDANIPNSAELIDSAAVVISGSSAEITWNTPDALAIHEGYTNTAGVRTPPLRWTRVALKRAALSRSIAEVYGGE